MQQEGLQAEEAEQLARATMANSTAQIVEGQSDHRGTGSDGGNAGVASAAVDGHVQEVPREAGHDHAREVRRHDLHVLDDEDGHDTAKPSDEGVSFAAILASLDGDPNVVVSEEALEAPLAAASSSEGPEGGSRQTNLSHWLK